MAQPRPLAVVTGASSGIGRAFAQRLAKGGYDLVLVARRKAVLEEMAEALSKQGGAAHVLADDLLAPGAAQRVFERVKEIGPCDALVNNAGVGLVGSFTGADLDRVRSMLTLNVLATTEMTYFFLKDMLARGRGTIANVSSTAAFQPVPHFAPYAASKAYVLWLTEAVAEEVRGSGVRLIAVCPGATTTEFNVHAGADSAQFKAAYMDPDDVARIAIERGLHGSHGVVVPGFFNSVHAVGTTLLPRQAVKRIAGWIYRRVGTEGRKSE